MTASLDCKSIDYIRTICLWLNEHGRNGHMSHSLFYYLIRNKNIQSVEFVILSQFHRQKKTFASIAESMKIPLSPIHKH